MTTHGDGADGDDWGINASSARSYTRRLPEGYSINVHASSSFYATALIDDVRKSGERLTFFMQYEFEKLPPGVQSRGATFFDVHNPEVTYHAQIWEFGRTFFPVRNEPSIAWWSVTMPVSGAMLPGITWSHGHRRRIYQILLLADGLDDMGCEDYGIGPRYAYPYGATSPVDDLDRTISKVLARDTCICRHDPKVPMWINIDAVSYTHLTLPTILLV